MKKSWNYPPPMLHNDDIDDGVFIQRSENGNKTSRSDETDQTKTATMVDK
jgi:hypothetical protein